MLVDEIIIWSSSHSICLHYILAHASVRSLAETMTAVAQKQSNTMHFFDPSLSTSSEVNLVVKIEKECESQLGSDSHHETRPCKTAFVI